MKVKIESTEFRDSGKGAKNSYEFYRISHLHLKRFYLSIIWVMGSNIRDFFGPKKFLEVEVKYLVKHEGLFLHLYPLGFYDHVSFSI